MQIQSTTGGIIRAVLQFAMEKSGINLSQTELNLEMYIAS